MRLAGVDAAWSKKLAQVMLPRGLYESLRRKFGQPDLVLVEIKSGGRPFGVGAACALRASTGGLLMALVESDLILAGARA
jgi:hypothetical protein